MKKRVLFGMLAAAILLGGCGKAETFETVADELDVPVLAQPRTVTVDIPGEAEQGALETASGRLYVTDDYEIILDDGNYHYCLSVERPADPEKASQVVWSQVFSSFGLEPESSDPY